MEQRVPRQSCFPRPLLTPTEEWNMKERLLITTAMVIMLGAGAFAQSPTDQSKSRQPPAAQNQTNPNSSPPSPSSPPPSQNSTPSAHDAHPTSPDTPSAPRAK